ncbi:MAG: L-threonylcarbamoyladenylate synthase [Pontibacterium sp.]
MAVSPMDAALAALKSGQVVAYPTEAVWGVGCDPLNHDAFKALLALKQRPLEKGVIIVAADIGQVQPLVAPLSDEQKAQLAATWPGPNTWILPDPNDWVPTWIKGQHAGVAVRVSDHPLVQALCTAFGPLVSTSANPAGAPPAMSAAQVHDYFPEGLGYVLDGPLGGLDKPTTIRDIQTNKTLR